MNLYAFSITYRGNVSLGLKESSVKYVTKEMAYVPAIACRVRYTNWYTYSVFISFVIIDVAAVW